VLVGILSLHGLAEELVWRGYVFRRLAQGRSFWPAVLRTMPLIALTHIPIVVTSGPAIGIGAMLVAAVTSIALGRLYAMGDGTLWAPGILHSAIDSFKLVVLPAAALPVYPFLIISFSLVVPLLVLAIPAGRTLPPLRPAHLPTTAPEPAAAPDPRGSVDVSPYRPTTDACTPRDEEAADSIHHRTPPPRRYGSRSEDGPRHRDCVWRSWTSASSPDP
jgi:hypothetical protein